MILKNIFRGDVLVIGVVSIFILLVAIILYGALDFHFKFSGDTVFYTFLKYQYIHESLSEGYFPFLNRFEGAGVPLFLSGSLDPMAYILLRWVNPDNYLVLAGFVYVILSIISMYSLLRSMTFTQNAALVGAFVWSFNAFNLQYAHEHVYAIFHIGLPISLIAIKKIVQREDTTILWSSMLVLVTACELLTGRWALVQYSFFIYFIWAFIWSGDRSDLFRLVIILLFVGVSSFALVSFFSVPYLYETINQTYRSTHLLNPSHPHWLRLIVDHFYPRDHVGSDSYFTPLVIIPLAIVGLSVRSRLKIVCLIFGIIYLLLGHDFKIYQLIQQLPFQSGNRVAVRFVIFYYLALSIMVSFGYDQLLATKNNETIKWSRFNKANLVTLALIIPIAGAALFFFLDNKFALNLAALLLYRLPLQNEYFGPIETLFATSATLILIIYLCSRALASMYRSFVLIGSILVIYTLCICVLALSIGETTQLQQLNVLGFLVFLGIGFYVRKRGPTISRQLYTVLLIGYIVGFGVTYNLMPIKSRNVVQELTAEVYKGHVSMLAKLHELSDRRFRITSNYEMPQRIYFSEHQIEDINYHLPLPDRRMLQYFSELIDVKAGVSSQRIVHASNFLRLANVRYYFLRINTRKEKIKELMDQGFSLVAKNKMFFVLEDKSTFNRYRLVSTFEVIENDKSTVTFLKQNSTNFEYFETSVVLNQSPGIEPSLFSNVNDEVQVLEYGSGHYRLKVDSAIDSILVIGDRFDRNWEFKVDNEPINQLRANLFFTGIPIKAGTHTIEANYAGKSVIRWVPLSIVVFLCLVAAVCFEFRQNFEKHRLMRSTENAIN